MLPRFAGQLIVKNENGSRDEKAFVRKVEKSRKQSFGVDHKDYNTEKHGSIHNSGLCTFSDTIIVDCLV